MVSNNKPWTAIHEKKFLWLLNYLKELDIKYKKLDEHFLKKFNKRTLLKIIHDNKKWGNSSKESIFFTTARWLEINDPNSNFIKVFKHEGYKLKTIRDKEEGENKLDAKEEENIKPYDYFINILDNIKPDEIQTKVEHYKYLILALLTLQPPVRTSFYTTAIITTDLKKIDDDKNYIYIKPDQCFYIINKDKVSNTKKYKMKGELRYIDINDKRLIKILNDSLIKYPRYFLFENTDHKIKDETFLKYLKAITHLSGLNVDMMRSIYITHFYSKNKTFKSREELALKMRHSQTTAQKNYLKISNVKEDPLKELENVKEENIKLNVRIKELEDELNKLKEQINPDEKTFIKKRNDILYKINIKNVKPKEDTLNKYNIIYDSDKQIYL